MNDEPKTQKQLMNELRELRQRVAELEVSEMERKQAEESLRQRTAQLEALRQVGLGLTAELDLDSLLHSIASRAVELLGGTAGGLDLYRPDRDVLKWTASIGFDPVPSEIVLRRGEGLSGQVWETGEPLILDDYHHWEGRAAGFEDYPFTAVVGVPVRWGEEFLGVLEVMAELPRTFSPADAELLSLFATQTAIVIRNARLYEEASSRAERLAVVNRIASAVGAILDLDDLMEAVYQEITSVFQADAFFIALYDEETNELDFRLRVDKGVREPREQRPLEIGLTAFVVSEQKPLLVRDFEKERNQLPEASLWGTMEAPSSWLGVPMLIGERLIGVICVQDYCPYIYGEEELLLLSTIADQVAVAIEQARLYEAERDQRDLAEALEEAAAALTATLDFDQVLDRILEQVGRVVPNDATNVMLIEGHQVRVVRWRGYERFGADDLFSTLVLDFSELRGFQQMADSREPMAIPDVTAYPGWVQVHEWLRSYAAAPIIVHGEVIGFLSVDSATRGFFTQGHAEALRAFADHAAVALENAHLYEAAQQGIVERERAEEELRQTLAKLREALGGIIQTVALTVETRDPYTAGHQRRVSNLARAIANEMGLSKEQTDGIRMAGLIHDLGKIAIPTEILITPVRLNDFQLGMIQTHPQVGYDILKTIDFPWPLAEIVLQHHERMDGSGYPQGLSGEEIMLEARVLAVADVVEAMASHRPYRPPHGLDKALEEISQNKGILYDPEVADACLKLFTEKGFELE